MTADGRASYDVQIDASGLPEPSSLGAVHGVRRVGGDDRSQGVEPPRHGHERQTTVGHAELNKFLLVITAESIATLDDARGPDGAARHVAERMAAVVS